MNGIKSIKIGTISIAAFLILSAATTSLLMVNVCAAPSEYKTLSNGDGMGQNGTENITASILSGFDGNAISAILSMAVKIASLIAMIITVIVIAVAVVRGAFAISAMRGKVQSSNNKANKNGDT